MRKQALLSVSDKTGVVDFARELAALGYHLLSTGGTAKLIAQAGIPVQEVADYTGFPEMLDGRVKTLNPKIHAGILARRPDPEHMKALADHNIDPIDIIVVNLYPFEATVAKPDCTFEDAIENIDIGGPTMIRAAAKNHESVAVVVDPADYGKVLAELKEKGEVSAATRLALAKKVFCHTARYDAMISNYLTSLCEDGQSTVKCVLARVCSQATSSSMARLCLTTTLPIATQLGKRFASLMSRLASLSSMPIRVALPWALTAPKLMPRPLRLTPRAPLAAFLLSTRR